ncbi:MAG: MBL fold metallo-hydrolase [Burkholderiales bacterium]|nr:MBL fold metallo-hydrolase [Burkholderiales bacterium]
MDIHFLGAADTVTGSKHLVTMAGQRILLDCGLFQGYKNLRERNWALPDLDLRELDAVVLSHAHLDHSGWLPSLVKRGYRGPIYASPASRDLAEVLLLDSAHLQEEDARRANKYGFTRHEKALPLYTTADAKRAIAKITPLPTGRELPVGKLGITLSPVGHLLGACAVTLRHKSESLAFSGDVGRAKDLVMPAPEPLAGADVLLVESTYGNRRHPPEDVSLRLAYIVRDTLRRGGTVLLPSFAVGRAQALLLVLQRLKAAGEIPDRVPIYLDSPMATEATALYRKHRRLLRIAPAEANALCDGVRIVTTGAQSQKLSASRYPAIIISASGMATGGRVLHHIKALAPDPRHHIVFAGFQVGGSRGAHMLAGATEVKIHGEYVPIRAQVSGLEGFSGHADADELLQWMGRMRRPPRQTFVVHGEPDAADALRLRIKDELNWAARVPQHGERVSL